MTAPHAAYRAEGLLGSGGLGRVYSAVHEPSGRAVALKTLHRAGTSEEAYRLLVREAAAAAQLHHPHVVELLDFVVTDQRPYLVLELVEGNDIERWVDEWPGSLVVARALDEILDGLSVAHAAGILHRDLKPANLLYTRQGSIKITDFGMAELVDPLATDRAFELGGTPLYMAPEQLDPFGLQGPWTDLYSIGVILFLLISGHEPIGPDDPDWRAAKRRPPPALVPRAGLRLPPELSRLVQRLLDPLPGGRPRFAVEVRRELRGLLPRIGEDGPVERGLAPSSRRRPSTLASAPTAVAPTPASDLGSAPTVSVDSFVVVADGQRQLPTGARAPERSEPNRTQPPPPLPLLPFTIPAPDEVATSTALLGLRAPQMVARAEERQLLLELASEVLASGRPRALTLIGEAGAGKSRIARWALSEVERLGMMEGTAAGYDVSGTTEGLRHALRRLLGPIWDPQAKLPRPAVWNRFRMGDADLDLGKLHAWLEATDAAGALSMHDRVALAYGTLAHVSRTRPIYLWLDDAAWSRDGALDLVEALLDAGAAPVLIVLTLRSGPADHPAVRARLDALLRRAGARERRITPLDAAQRAELMSGVAPLAPAAAAELAAALDETPFVLVQMARELILSGALVTSHDGWTLPAGTSTAQLIGQRSMSELLSARVGKLLQSFGEHAADAEDVLMRAALLGERFDDVELGAAVKERYKRRFVFLVVSRALLHGILRAEPNRSHRFEHDLVRSAVLNGLDRRRDQGAILRAVAAGVLEVHGRISIHGRVHAAQLIERAGGHDEAMDLLSAAILDQCLCGTPDEVDEPIRLAWSWVERTPDPRRSAQVLLAESTRAYFALDYPLSVEKARAARELARQAGDERLEILSHATQASSLFYQGRLREAEELARDVLSRCPSGHEPTALAAMNVAHRMAEIHVLRGELETAKEYFAQACEHARVGGDQTRAIVIEFDIADVELALGQLDAAEARLARLRELAADPRSRDWAPFLLDISLRARVRRGLGASALPEIGARMAAFRAAHDLWRISGGSVLAALAAAQSGDRALISSAVSEMVTAFEACLHEKAMTFCMLDELRHRLDALGMGHEAALVEKVREQLRAWIAQGFREGG